MPPTTGSQEKFVPRFEMAIMQYAILDKAQQGEVTRDNLKQLFRGNLQMSSDHFDHCVTTLVQDGHLKEIGGNKYTITDDGREDIQKLSTLVLELPNVIHSGKGQQGQQRQGAQQQAVGGGGGSTGTTQGTQGGYGTSAQRGSDAGQGQPRTSGADTGGKGGATSPGTGQNRADR